MRLAKISANGQVTLPVRIRELLEVLPGDRIAFIENDRGEIVLSREPDGGVPMPVPGLAEQVERFRLRRESEEELEVFAHESWGRWLQQGRTESAHSAPDYD